MLDIIRSGGWLMLPILLSSVIALTIILERLWTLRKARIMPEQALIQAREWIRHDTISLSDIQQLQQGSPMGKILAAGIQNRNLSYDVIKESINEQASQVVHKLEHYLNTLGTIASVAPLLGLLGTVIGMIDVFTVIMSEGTGNTSMLAGGISKALITTAAGLSVAIPSLIFHRYFSRRIDELVISMEQETTMLMASICQPQKISKDSAREQL
ncbi:Biopolymer transport protein ExbB [invertebrate metagenome]|uniref:Biopolymer transport protein ExbB n=1 Tax=invertebrate metagenome TaxID=1711999 RepID=A0A2H9T8G9_9ZZZZ